MSALRRLYLQAVAAWLDLIVFFAEVDSDAAVRTLNAAEDELTRSLGWADITAGRLQTARREAARAQQAIARHDRHVELGIY